MTRTTVCQWRSALATSMGLWWLRERLLWTTVWCGKEDCLHPLPHPPRSVSVGSLAAGPSIPESLCGLLTEGFKTYLGMSGVGGTFQTPPWETAGRLFWGSCDIAEALTSSSQLKFYSLLGLKGSSFTTHGVSELSMTISQLCMFSP